MTPPRPHRRARRESPIRTVATFIIVAVLAAAFVWWIWTVNFGSERTETCTVTGMDWAQKVTSGNSTSEYRIQTEECGVLKITDNLLRLQFNSADRYAELEEGATYEFTLIGFRIGLFSMFPNIIAAEEVTR